MEQKLTNFPTNPVAIKGIRVFPRSKNPIDVVLAHNLCLAEAEFVDLKSNSNREEEPWSIR
jgi:hypothetical protein